MTPSTPPVARCDDDFERLLFDSARQVRVPADSRQRVARALGIAPVAPLAGAVEPQVPTKDGASGAPEAAGGAIAEVGRGKLALLGKSALVGLAGGIVALGVALLDRSSPAPVAATEPAVVASAALPALAATSVVLEHDAPERSSPSADIARGEPAEEALAPRPRRTVAKHKAKPIASRTRDSQNAVGAANGDAAASRLLDEVRRLDAARNALAADHAAQALAELGRYEREFPGGTLQLDAALLEVRALDRAGRRAAAHQRARALLARPGAERHRAELEALVNPLASGSKARRRDIEGTR